MTDFEGKFPHKVTFHNQPKLSEDEVDRGFNERRLALMPLVEEYLSNQEMFDGKDVEVTFSHDGVSSLVSIIDGADKKMVLKIALSTNSAYGEAMFLKAWEQVGVSVPHIVDDGLINNQPYLFYEYVDAPLLADVYDHEARIEKGIYLEMGQTLRLMHEAKGEGYGKIVKDKAEYDSFAEWINGPDMKERVEYVHEHKLLGEEHGSVEAAFKILIDHASRENKSSYCHFDFGGNIFATHPLTVFDPSPGFNNGYIDLGRTLINHAANGIFTELIIDGYFGDEVYDRKALQASVLLNAYFKLPYQHKKNRSKFIKNIQDHLVKTRFLLD